MTEARFLFKRLRMANLGLNSVRAISACAGRVAPWAAVVATGAD